MRLSALFDCVFRAVTSLEHAPAPLAQGGRAHSLQPQLQPRAQLQAQLSPQRHLSPQQHARLTGAALPVLTQLQPAAPR